MSYIQIDNFNGNINIVCSDDGSGEPLIFETLEEAEETLMENCQDGIIIPLVGTIDILRRISSLFNSGKLIIKEEAIEDTMNFFQLKKDLNELL